MDVHAKAKKWGNSWGVIIPKDEAEKLHLHENAYVHVNLEKTPTIQELVGTFKSKKSTDELKKEIKKGWKE